MSLPAIIAMSNTPPVSATSALPDAEACWRAVQMRDATADGRFVYAVSSTGVYCRPSCPSRPARREHVSFHADCASAERAGFRACKRCRPDGLSPAQQQRELVLAACRHIDACLTAGTAVPTLDALASAAGLSRFH
ncbi:MAG: Ada metal-binding domain-containing protein, partial [Perlucidibaca sp.]